MAGKRQELGKGVKQVLPWVFQRGQGPADTLILDFCCFNPGLWCFVTQP